VGGFRAALSVRDSGQDIAAGLATIEIIAHNAFNSFYNQTNNLRNHLLAVRELIAYSRRADRQRGDGLKGIKAKYN
jgi:hypothetical protein